ncbi:hypothetical protein [Streptomyces sp. GbtcB6]|nr:hypothetical protein [Streptomyces sp. GbtcB6]
MNTVPATADTRPVRQPTGRMYSDYLYSAGENPPETQDPDRTRILTRS